MKKLTLILLVLFNGLTLLSQIQDHIKWSNSVKKINETEAELVFNATIDEGWHLYGQYFGEGGPLRLEFIFENSADYKRIGKVTENPKPIEIMDEVFEIKVQYFVKNATFTQKIKINSKQDFLVKGTIKGQICMEDGACIMVDEDFEFKIKAPSVKETGQTSKDKSLSNLLAKKDLSLPINADTIKTPAKNDSKIAESQTDNENTSLWLFFWISFGAGLIAILTPCVFPMIPMTVSFFMHSGKSKTRARFEALFYGISIVLIYTIIGTIVAFTLGPSFANFLSTHWLPNIFFFLIFMLFAASFFGMFEIVLPSWMVNKADKQVDKGGIWGPFFMAFTLVLVSFSCTGPIVGTVLVQSAGGEFLKPIIGMLGFSLAFALPFSLFAFFPSWLSNLPKSGGWLNTVKVVLGFIELALGLKFLSMADLTYHWHLLDREVFLAFWIVIFLLLGVYLLGKLRFAHDSEIQHISVPRLFLAIITFTFVVYMIPGMWGAPLKALSGYIPPMTTQDFDMVKIVRENATSRSSNSTTVLCDNPKYGDFLHLPHGIEGYFDWDQGIACARKLNKPVFIDFTGHGCANCRKMEENVWVDPRVLERLKKDFIVISLYVDDKTVLPENEWIKTPEGKIKKTIGDKYSYIQETRFKANSQPHYIILDTAGNQLGNPKFFDLDKDKFVEFLDNGKDEFRKLSLK
ncbi:MAG: cytochrome c biogenesis protein CcdA [Bacteroidales bacterium]